MSRVLQMKMRFSSSPYSVYIVVAPLLLVLIGYVFYPLLSTFMTSVKSTSGISLGNYIKFFKDIHGASLESLGTSVYISVLSVICCGVVGIGMAILLTRYEFPGRRILAMLALVPMALPALIGVMSFEFLFGDSGVLPRALQLMFHLSSAPALHGIGGVVVVHTFTMYTYVYLVVSGALSTFDSSVEEAAYNLGASRIHVWSRVLLPMLTPSIVASSLLVFMLSMASYTAPLVFGIDHTMTMQIYLSTLNGNLGLGATQASVLSIVSILFLVTMRWYQGQRSYRNLNKGVTENRNTILNPASRYWVMALAVVLMVILLSPVLMIVLLSLSVDGTWTTQILPPKYTLHNFGALFANVQTFAPIRNSLEMSLLATIADLVIGLVAAYLITRKQFKGKMLIDVLIMLPWALPGTVVGVNLISAFNKPSLLTAGSVLVGTFWILPLAYFVRHLPLTFRAALAAFEQFDTSAEDAARNLGASWWYSFRRVVLPMVIGGVLSGALLAFVEGVGEFVTSILLYTLNSMPISVQIWQKLFNFQFGSACAYGVLQIVLIVLVLLFTSRMSGRSASITL